MGWSRILCVAILFSTLSTSVHSATWSDSVLTAIGMGDRIAVFKLAMNRKPSCDFVTGYAGMLKQRRASPVRLDSVYHFSREVSALLASNAVEACYESYRSALEDTTLPEVVRVSVLNSMLSKVAKFGSEKKSAFISSQEGLLSRSNTPKSLKRQILINWNRSAPGAGPQILLRTLGSQDSVVREAAYQGLAIRVKKNRHAGNTGANRVLYDSLLRRDSASQSINQVRVIASIGENYARDYLLAHCAGDSRKIAAIIYRDDSLTHLGLVREALRLASSGVGDRELEKALRQGTKDPEKVLEKLIDGSAPDTTAGLELMKIFPQYALANEAVIRAKAQSADSLARKASEALLPLLPDAPTQNPGNGEGQ